MPIGFADNVGVGVQSRSALSPRKAIETLRDILTSPQFHDGVRLFAIGAAVSASKVVFDTILSVVKRLFIGQATFRGRDEAFRWMLLFMVAHPAFRRSPRAVEITARPTLLLDHGADYRGEINEEEARATWGGLQFNDNGKNTAGNKENIGGVHFFPAAGESVAFTFDGVRFWARRTRELVGDEVWEESIQLSFLSISSKPLHSIVAYAKKLYKDQSRGRVMIHQLNRYGDWYEAAGIAKRLAASVHLPSNVKETLLQDAKSFFSADVRRWYADRGIPYRRGYLLYGTPGSGKSSLCHVLASEMQRKIYSINLGAASLTDEGFTERMAQVPPGALLLIEDVDAAFPSRVPDETDTPKTAKKGAVPTPKQKKKSGISFSALLNAIDGIGAAEGRILCMTTNHRDALDPALVRPGRIDLQLSFTHATPEQAKALFSYWYMPRNGELQQSEGDKGQIQVLADQFAEQVPENTVSVAALQGFLLQCGTDCEKASKEIGEWIVEQN